MVATEVEAGHVSSEPTAKNDNGVVVMTSVCVELMVDLGPVDIVLAMKEICECVFVDRVVVDRGVCEEEALAVKGHLGGRTI